MPTVFGRIQADFLVETKRWFQKADNFDKHVHYLREVLLKGYSTHYEPQAFVEAVNRCRTDIDTGVAHLLAAIEPALRQMLADQQQKGDRICDSYRTGHLQIRDGGNRKLTVQSESNPQTTHIVNLSDYTCNCPHYKTLSYSRMWCKHLCAAQSLFNTVYPVHMDRKTTRSDSKKASPSHWQQPHETAAAFGYGSQQLPKRQRTGNPLVPSGHFYILPPETELVIYALAHNESLLLIGDSGTGKSMLIAYLAQETHTPLLAPSAHVEMTVENLLGSMQVVNGNTVFKDGVIPQAMKRGYWLLLDELNSLDAGVLKALNELLDTGKLTITVAGEPRLVKAHKEFRLIATMNPPDNPIYKGVEAFSFEFIDRFQTVIHLDYLPPEVETQLLLEQTGLKQQAIAQKMVQFATHVRAGMRKGELFATVTTRSLLAWAKKATVFDLKLAAEASILSKMSAADRQKALDLYQAIFK